MSRATSSCAVVQPLSSMAGPSWPGRSALPLAPSIETVGDAVAAMLVTQTLDGSVRLMSSNALDQSKRRSMSSTTAERRASATLTVPS